MKTEITSSIRLRLTNIVQVKPWLILSILKGEFVKMTRSEAKELEYAFTEKNDVGTVHFDSRIARMYRSDEVLYVRFENEATYSLPLEDEK